MPLRRTKIPASNLTVDRVMLPTLITYPADKMAVITMHKLMGLLMTNNGGIGSVRVVQAACAIGEAIEQEVRIHRFLEKTKKKKNTN
ncbi:hypothetical protein L3X38_005817 [Prunus dulcis]|uniref:DNA-directed RNA polymerase N-terminal domain-containing protein n=1 Tax=Prunus dulcis TaxID=3755 RepID=A0AAD5F4K3_PRUDU|nr:hypothetical protein L3X38_005817 [Prunus dulcis]